MAGRRRGGSLHRVENLTELASSIKDYEKNSDSDFPDLAGFLEEAALMTDVDNYDASADSVVMMTMHAAKGLEFPVVFLPGFEDGIFPGMQTIYQPEEMEEERRLCYVAITRAKEELYLLHANSRMLSWIDHPQPGFPLSAGYSGGIDPSARSSRGKMPVLPIPPTGEMPPGSRNRLSAAQLLMA